MRRHLIIIVVCLLASVSSAPAADVPTPFGVVGSGGGSIPQPEFAVLWDQPLSAVNQNAYANQEFTDFPTYSCFVADDFIVPIEGWSVEALFIPNEGFNGGDTFLDADMLHFQVWADAGGVPAGYPGIDTPVWSLDVLPSDSQITLSVSSGGANMLNLLLTLTTPFNLPSGTYWLVFYGTGEFASDGQWGRQGADTTNGYTTQWANPGGGFGYGTTWQGWGVLGATLQDSAFRIEGTVLPVELQSFTAE